MMASFDYPRGYHLFLKHTIYYTHSLLAATTAAATTATTATTTTTTATLDQS